MLYQLKGFRLVSCHLYDSIPQRPKLPYLLALADPDRIRNSAWTLLGCNVGSLGLGVQARWYRKSVLQRKTFTKGQCRYMANFGISKTKNIAKLYMKMFQSSPYSKPR